MTAFHGASGVPGEPLHELRELARLLEPEPRRDPVERLERERDLDEVGVAGPLPHPVHRALHPGRARLDRRDGRRRREAEVVVTVPVDGNLVVEPLDDLVRRGTRPPRAWRSRACPRRRPPPRPPRPRSRRRRARTRGRRGSSRRRRSATRIPCSDGEARRPSGSARASSRARRRARRACRPRSGSRSPRRRGRARRAPRRRPGRRARSPRSRRRGPPRGSARSRGRRPRRRAGSPPRSGRPRARRARSRSRACPRARARRRPSARRRAASCRRGRSSRAAAARAPSRSGRRSRASTVESEEHLIACHFRRDNLPYDLRLAEGVAGMPRAGTVSRGGMPGRYAHDDAVGNGESFSAPSAVIRKLSSTRSPPPPSI